VFHEIYCSRIGAKKQGLSLDPTGFYIDKYIPSSVEKSESSENLDLESIIGKEIHQWKESKIRSECQSTTRASRKDGSDGSSYHPDERLCIDICLFSVFPSFVYEGYEK
jgi:hypothetical protein